MKKFFAALFAILFVVLLPVVVISSLFQWQFGTAARTQRFVEKAEIAKAVPTIFTDVVVQSAGGAMVPGAPNPIDIIGGREKVQVMFEEVFPENEVNTVLNEGIEESYRWWKSNEPVEQYRLAADLTQFKQRFISQGSLLLQDAVDKLPVCTPEQAPVSPEEFDFGCNPKDFMSPDLINFEEITTTFTQSIPDRWSIQEVIVHPQQTNENLKAAHKTVEQINRALWILRIVVLVSLLLIIILRIKPVTALLAWTGWSILLGGFFTTLVSGMVVLFPNIALLTINILKFTGQEAPILPVIISSIANQFFLKVLIVGGSIFVLGLILIIVGQVLKHRSKRASTPVNPPQSAPSTGQ